MLEMVIPRFGGPEVFEARQRPTVQPGPGQVLIHVEAAGVNFADLMARMGLYDKTPPLPAVIGWEVAGSIEAVGEGVPADRVGEAIVAATHFGGYATHAVVDAINAVPRPAGLDVAVAAAIPVHGLSAWMMLEVMGRVRAGDRVLIHSAGGGLGLMAVQLAKRRGAWAVGTASGSKHTAIRAAGYDQLIDYRTTDVAEALRGQEGFDLILDPLGGSSWRQSFGLLRGGGRLCVFGYSGAVTGRRRSLRSLLHTMKEVPWTLFTPFTLMRMNKGVLGIEMEHMWHEAPRLRQWLETLVALAETGEVVPWVHARVPLTRVAEAHQLLHDRQNIGKVVLVNDVD